MFTWYVYQIATTQTLNGCLPEVLRRLAPFGQQRHFELLDGTTSHGLTWKAWGPTLYMEFFQSKRHILQKMVQKCGKSRDAVSRFIWKELVSYQPLSTHVISTIRIKWVPSRWSRFMVLRCSTMAFRIGKSNFSLRPISSQSHISDLQRLTQERYLFCEKKLPFKRLFQKLSWMKFSFLLDTLLGTKTPIK